MLHDSGMRIPELNASLLIADSDPVSAGMAGHSGGAWQFRGRGTAAVAELPHAHHVVVPEGCHALPVDRDGDGAHRRCMARDVPQHCSGRGVDKVNGAAIGADSQPGLVRSVRQCGRRTQRGDVRSGFTSYWDTYFAGRAAPLGLAAAEVVTRCSATSLPARWLATFRRCGAPPRRKRRSPLAGRAA